MKRTILLFAALMSFLPFWAKDDYLYRNITMNDGLTSNTVRNIVQDDQGFIWFGTDNGLCRYDGMEVQPYRISELGANQYVSSLLVVDDGLYIGTGKGVFFLQLKEHIIQHVPVDIQSTVTSLSYDEEDCLWISTFEQGVWQYNPATGKAIHYEASETGGAVAQVYVDKNNQVWTVTNWGYPAVQRLNRLHNRFEPLNISTPDASLNYSALCMLQSRDGQIWIGTWENGLMLLHSDGRLEQVLSPSLSKVGLHIHTLNQLSDNCICIGCDDGAICYNPQTREWRYLIGQDNLKTRFVYAITSDKEGGIWIGTFYSGVNYVSPVGKRFEAFTTDSGLSGNVISRFCEDQEGRVWVASDDGGLMCYLPSEHRFATYPHQEVLRRQNVHALCLAGDELWVGTYTNGVLVLNVRDGRLRQYTRTDDAQSLDNSSSYAIHQDRKGNIWVATMMGLNLYHRSQDAFERVGQTYNMIIDIDEDNEGNLWLSTQGEGLWKYLVSSKELISYLHHEDDQHSLTEAMVNCTHVDENNRLWIGTQGGLYQYDNGKDGFVRIPLDVPSLNVMSIIEDNGALWLSTDRGIVKYDPKQLQRFTLHDGLVSEQFQPNSALKTSDGHVYFGSTSGFNVFLPYKIKANNVMPPVFITTLEMMNHQELTTSGLPADLSQATKLVLDYSEARMLTLSFASLSYCSPGKNQYAYRLEGFDREWNYVGNQNRATYTNLPEGTYVFRVKATNNDGIWSDKEATLRIVVQPPFWWSWWAKLFYVLLIAALFWYYVHMRLRRAERTHQQELKSVREQNEQESREARLSYFTMIAHEIRTPVSLIIAPLEQMKKELGRAGEAEGTLHSSLQIIDRNAHRLLELVNQLLDFRKVEQQSLVMRFASHNVSELMHSVSERFEPTFQQGGKTLTTVYPPQRFSAIIDREGITKVISNLLTNAVKYSNSAAELRCIIDPDESRFQIIVTDDGVGIKPEDQQRIFAPFFQAEGNKPGTGIGLSIVKRIVDLHHGTISVASELGKGTTFTVTLPVQQEMTAVEDSAATAIGSVADGVIASTNEQEPVVVDDSAASGKDEEQPYMLIVDDNEDMVQFLADHFRHHYRVLTALDGVEALSKLSKHHVSIIVSDWMMPRMDGVELCRRVRANVLTSHIPFLMLTAKTDNQSKIEGMNIGADVYIEKPFSVDYLEACIANILQMRRLLMKKVSTEPWEDLAQIGTAQVDNELLTKMNKLIEENISNAELNVNFLASQLNISRSGLFAKIKTLAEVTPNEMIQMVRLKRAAQLLSEGRYMVSEIGYMVGFSNPSYFSKCFQKQFGIRPADYAKNASSHPRNIAK